MRGAEPLRRQFGGLVNLPGASLRRVLRWIRLTGGMPSMTGKDPAGHMLLVRDRFPEVYARTHKFLNVLDYMNLRLTGRFVATHDSILTSWVTDNRDVDRDPLPPGAWCATAASTPTSCPEIVPCTEVLGPLRPEVAGALGLPADVQVVAGAIDTTAAAVGSGARGRPRPAPLPRHLHLDGGPRAVQEDRPGHARWPRCPAPSRGAGCSPRCRPPPAATSPSCATRSCTTRTSCSRKAACPTSSSSWTGWPSGCRPAANGVLYTPWIWGERAPVEDRTLRAGLLNLSLENDRADIDPRLPGGRGPQLALAAGAGGEVPGAPPCRRSAWSAAGPAPTSGARSTPTCWTSRWCRWQTRSRPTPGAPPSSPPSACGRLDWRDVPGRWSVRRAYQPTAAHREALRRALRRLHRRPPAGCEACTGG